MLYLKFLTILGIVIKTVYCNNDTTTMATEETTEGNVTLAIDHTVRAAMKFITPTKPISTMSAVITTDTSNVTKHFVLQGKRRAVVIINRQSVSSSALRNRGRGKKKKSRGPDARNAQVESLLYEEYHADGRKLVEFMMYSLEDVSTFFSMYLHTEICHGQCELRPEDKAREDAKKENT